MTDSTPPRSARRPLIKSAIGAVAAFLSTLVISSVWRANGWPGATFAAPATFFLVMGATFAWTSPQLKERPMSFKVLIAAMYGLFGAIVVGGLTTMLQ